jgi:hypothetical protein
VTSSGPFVIPGIFTDKSTYTLTVTGQPTGQTCTVPNPSGTVIAGFTANVAVTCASTSS